MNVSVKSAVMCLVSVSLAAGVVMSPLPSRADMVDDWLNHKTPAAEPKITCAGDPIQLKFSHPTPPPRWSRRSGAAG